MIEIDWMLNLLIFLACLGILAIVILIFEYGRYRGRANYKEMLGYKNLLVFEADCEREGITKNQFDEILNNFQTPMPNSNRYAELDIADYWRIEVKDDVSGLREVSVYTINLTLRVFRFDMNEDIVSDAVADFESDCKELGIIDKERDYIMNGLIEDGLNMANYQRIKIVGNAEHCREIWVHMTDTRRRFIFSKEFYNE